MLGEAYTINAGGLCSAGIHQPWQGSTRGNRDRASGSGQPRTLDRWKTCPSVANRIPDKTLPNQACFFAPPVRPPHLLRAPAFLPQPINLPDHPKNLHTLVQITLIVQYQCHLIDSKTKDGPMQLARGNNQIVK